MKFYGLLALTVLSLPSIVGAQPLPVNREAVWFKPSLAVNSSPVCADILRVEQGKFFSERGRFDYAELKPIEKDPQKNTDWQVETGDYGQLILRPNGQPVNVKFARYVGCSGACETQGLEVSGKGGSAHVPAGPDWEIYKAPDEQFYAIGSLADEDRLQAYRISAPANLELVCEVARQPKKIAENENPAVRQAWQSIETLRKSAGSIFQGGGCGQFRPYERGPWLFEHALKEAVYRPWIPSPEDAGFESGFPASLSDFRRRRETDESQTSIDGLQIWALGGIGDYRAWQSYLSQLERTTKDLAVFYRQKFAWSDVQAREQAERVIHRAVDFGVPVPSSDSEDAGLPLRQAILERQPLDVIKQLELVERPDEVEGASVYRTYDSILNLAIEYPEALQYLLSRGLDPNAVNQFGKTPLMYAAQYNQLESTRILLAAGANPNATTYVPQDACYYSISTSDMTPLHYAVRYASASLIRTLAAAGGATFNSTHKEYRGSEEYPIDWLKKYTAPGPERNPNLTAAEVPALFDLLRVPSADDRQSTSVTLATRGQAEYARGEFKAAYRSLQLALSAQPTNEKVLADMSLVAFKAGEYEAAAEVAHRVIDSSASASVRASAWFNLGLVCERADVHNRLSREASCEEDWLWPFVQAWKLQPTRARADRLRQAFDLEGTGSCSKSGQRRDLKIWSIRIQDGEVERIHILHVAGDPLDIESDTQITRVIDNLPIHDQALTVIERAPDRTLPLINDRGCHMPPRYEHND